MAEVLNNKTSKFHETLGALGAELLQLAHRGILVLEEP
jgi:hypothetical protein